MKKILLVNPNFGSEAPSEKTLNSRSVALNWSPFKVVMVPLGLATIAALTPDDVEVDIWDETVDGTLNVGTKFKKDYDLVGVTGFINHSGRVKELGHIFRRRHIMTAVGGPGVSSEPELFRDHYDILFVGEAEYTWPRFIDEWKSGSHRKEYRQVGKVDMSHTPSPRWDTVSVSSYLMGAVQTTRGCPFDCEFCDVIYIYGRQARHKSIDRVLEEVCALQTLGVKRIYFCDDNFIGNPRYAKALVRELIPLNRSFHLPVSFFAQLSLNVAKDDEMLELMADADFPGVFIGLESPNIESLIETNKPQNYKTDMVADVKKIQSYGIIIQGGMIVGFDHDDNTIFNLQFDFIQETGIPVPMINILKAPIGTKLWVRLHKEGRVFKAPNLRQTTNVESLTNIIPKQMTLVELLSSYIDLVEKVRDWRNFETRVRAMISRVGRRPNVRRRSYWREILMFPLLLYGMTREGRRTTLRLLLYTFRRAPFMVESVMGAVSFQYLEALRVPSLKESVGEQIRLLTEKSLNLEREQTVFFIPDGFEKPYKTIFPELFGRIYQGLADKSRTHDVLVELTYDFLTRWGLSFRQFEEYHRVFFYELCDRSIAAENRNIKLERGEITRLGELPIEFADPTRKQASFWLKQLSDDVLHCVEQDLRSFHPKTLESELKTTLTG